MPPPVENVTQLLAECRNGNSEALDKLFRRQSAAQRDFNKALAELRRLQDARTELDMFQAAALPPLPAELLQSIPADPALRPESQSRRL